MRQIVYISTATPLVGSEIGNILETAVSRNSMRGITGFLLYNGRNFLQLIEGGSTELMVLMNRLARDHRHNGMVTLENRLVEERAFPTWAMRQLPLAETLDRRRLSIEQQIGNGLDEQIRRTVLNFAELN